MFMSMKQEFWPVRDNGSYLAQERCMLDSMCPGPARCNVMCDCKGSVLVYCVSTVLLGVGGTVASESTLRSAGTLLSRVRAPPPAPWLDGGPESLRSPCCGLAIYKNQTSTVLWGCTKDL
ncbi:prolyl 4-hydroxylase subunit alpha-1-like protein [Plakobranchus ocellatus]|uniref:Prolyl 4-hydroxylase subunit alpha-1-like protein n=1 Tax=Plakobranchus ocellatus TaxID=259542 RepID=A0AAV3YMR7_9GAST|nr:prolyl 4-hydroxylase subunit alpha-1-like protein [Plakobranchus ocellatus]